MKRPGGSSLPAKTLLVWDREGPPPRGAWTAVNWRSFAENAESGVISLPAYVEGRSDFYRAAFLAWLHELSLARISGKTVLDHLELRPGLSYWWMSSLGQRFNAWGTSPIHDAIKAMALEHLIVSEGTRALILASENKALAEVLELLTRELNVRYEWRHTGAPAGRVSVSGTLRGRLPPSARAARYIWSRLRAESTRESRVAPAGKITFVDVLAHLAPGAVETGKFDSGYWTSLVDVCRRQRLRTNWLHVFFMEEPTVTPACAEKILRTFTETSHGLEAHVLLESELPPAVLWGVLRDLTRLARASWRLVGIRRHFRPGQSRLDLWPLFRREWSESLRGPMAVVNCLYLAAFEQALQKLPRQERGFYIQENQPWEMALIHVWRGAGHGELIGVPHTTVRFWDLRYFYDPRSYERCTSRANNLPLPDRVAVNGPVARKMYVEGGYPEEDLVDVEALRYLHLTRTISAPVPQGSGLRVLVCGDFLASTTHRILSSLKAMDAGLPRGTIYVFKPHPAYPADLSQYDGPELRVSTAPLSELLPNCDVAFTGSISSSAADAYCAGVPVVQLMDEGGFNMSPLRGFRGVTYVTNGAEAATAVRGAGHRHVPELFFNLDPGLPRWRKLLGVSDASSGRETGELQ